MIPHSRPTIDERDVTAVSNTLRTGNIAQGRVVEKFEHALADYIGLKGGVATSSGTAALHLALLALGITKNDVVAIPGYVCTAVLNAVNYVGATPLLIDIDPDTFNLDVTDLRRKQNPHVKAVVVPHLFGLTANIEEITKLGIPVIEDCAQSIGATYKKKPAGSFGTISIFSFYATKMMTTGEGGMVASNAAALLRNARDLRDYDNQDDYRVRYNYKMTDFQAALGLAQLKHLPRFIKIRREIANKYHRELKDLCALPVNYGEEWGHIYYRYVIKLSHGLKRFLKLSKDKGINCERPVFKPLHKYLSLSNAPNTDRVWEQAASIPIYPTLTEKNTDSIIRCVKQAIEALR
ncbi:MAG TPA: DegT/DnrJ/EryC1/StrS aminotransferase family protein [Candidatus Brocadiaceae bacterium]|nr:DegT/DnrJ/EryC1/StrS aminotransferase family protein [Candidatus Brocadiaceae bacterium]